MLKGKNVNIRDCPKNLKTYLFEVLSLYDSVHSTIYSKEFYYIYIDCQLYSLKELGEILNISNTALHVHMHKINKYIDIATERIKVRQ